ncbi:MAG: 23S rRNA (pseudouridine(1915)-N(3))-methyltransferase RlmH [SAR86 cluster bacterium]|jgi:23S rRNA (pseudouridine1915-N3)-methyltransferase|nr:23S rRNA (pseudouridine(1915)-N(3))-methyltransferase RlmH [SAR86 cluster bacterium]|tara:strand:+ start:15175 stop:15645 length:471 start_codon:yes stop_codon:yes gene_type:complete
MEIIIVSLSGAKSNWSSQAFESYCKRFDKSIQMSWKTLSPEKRTNKINNPQKIIQKEGVMLLNSTKNSGLNIALDRKGVQWTTHQLHKRFIKWRESHKSVNFLIGGADGHGAALIDNVDEVWSLSALTFPHGIVPLLIVEQIYRVWSLTKNHPYHR